MGLIERLRIRGLQGLDQSTNVPDTIAANRLLSERIPYPPHLGITEAGTSVGPESAVALGTLLADGIGDTTRISLSTFHAEEEVKDPGTPEGPEAAPAWPGPDRVPDLRAPPVRHGHRGRRHRAPPGGLRGPDPGAPGVRGDGIGEASHADFGIMAPRTRASPSRAASRRRTSRRSVLVDELFIEIDSTLGPSTSTPTPTSRPRAPSGSSGSRRRTRASSRRSGWRARGRAGAARRRCYRRGCLARLGPAIHAGLSSTRQLRRRPRTTRTAAVAP